ncbi:hypothetical protein ACIQAR_17685 [Micromonospora chalcea]
MNPILRLALAICAGVLVVSIQPSNPAAWAFGVAAFIVVMGAQSKRRR